MTVLLTKDAILKKLVANKAQLTAFGVQEIGLFGSYACNQATAKSDIDLLVDIVQNKKTLRNYLKIVYFLEALFSKKVELITKQSLSKHIGPHILKTVEYVSIAD
jgi:predicted nucleotidyltransferase